MWAAGRTSFRETFMASCDVRCVPLSVRHVTESHFMFYSRLVTLNKTTVSWNMDKQQHNNIVEICAHFCPRLSSAESKKNITPYLFFCHHVPCLFVIMLLSLSVFIIYSFSLCIFFWKSSHFSLKRQIHTKNFPIKW